MRLAVEDLIRLVQTYPRENADMELDANDCVMFRRHYSRLMYQVRKTGICCRAG